MDENKRKEFRDWVNMGVGIIGLIFLIIATFLGYSEIKQIRIDLEEINTRSISSEVRFNLLPNGSIGSCEYYDENLSCTILAGTCPPEILEKYGKN